MDVEFCPKETKDLYIENYKTLVKEIKEVKVKSLGSVRLSVIPWTAAYQAPPSMEFFRQEYKNDYYLQLKLWLFNNNVSFSPFKTMFLLTIF